MATDNDRRETVPIPSTTVPRRERGIRSAETSSFTRLRIRAARLGALLACIMVGLPGCGRTERRDDTPAVPNSQPASGGPGADVTGALPTGLPDSAVPAAARQPVPAGVHLVTDRATFEARLGASLRLVNFDDIETPARGHVAFSADRYKAKGIIITGQGGQYVSREFGYPANFRCVSSPNMYAPGPTAPTNAGPHDGGHETTVTFIDAAGNPALVAAFGCYFIDCNYPNIGPSSIEAFDGDGRSLRIKKGFQGATGAPLFFGFVVTDPAGQPLPAIAKVQLVNGSSFPEVYAGEGVTLDDFVFSAPQSAAGGTAVAKAEPPSSKVPQTTTPAPSPQPKPAPVEPRPAQGERPMPPKQISPEAAQAQLLDMVLRAFTPGEISADTRATVTALLQGDVAQGRATLTRANDRHGRALQLAAGLLDRPIIDPFSLIAYTLNFHEPSAAFVPNGQPDPVAPVLNALRQAAQVDPTMRPYLADAVRTMCVVQLLTNLGADRPVGLSDHLLFSDLRFRKAPGAQTKGSSSKFGAPQNPSPLLPQAQGALDLEVLCSDPEDRKRYLGKSNAPRYWFLLRNVRKDNYYLCTGLWYNAMTFADKIEPASRERWDEVFTEMAAGFAVKGRYTSALIVKVLSGTNAIPFLAEWSRRADPKDAPRVTNLVIAFGYFLEARRGQWNTGLKGTALGDWHDRLAQIAPPEALDIARRCGGVDRTMFEKAP